VTQVPASAHPRRLRLLVVDDEPHIGLLLRPHLESLGYDITLARTLAEARAALQDADAVPAGLLLDLHLPDGSGLDLLRELRAVPRTRVLPVLVLTAEGEERVLQDVQRLGAQLLTKPFSPTKLAAHVAAMCAGAEGVSA
jgi:DNA-binding response OmpR family regulator